MRVKNFIAYFLGFVFIAFLLFSAFGVYKYYTNEPPLAEIEKARERLSLAKKELAGKYAIEKLKEAENLYGQAMGEWQFQNEKLFVFRDFTMTRELAEKSFNIASHAKEEAGTVKNNIKERAKTELQQLQAQITFFEKYYKKLSLSRSTFDSFNTGKIKYFEARHEFEKAEYNNALKLGYKAAEKLSQAEKAASFKLREFYNAYPEWQKNIKLAHSMSKKGQTVILVDKMEASFTILKAGKEVKTYQAEFGPNWMGHKMIQGDRTTPEGIYRVVKKKSGSKTKFYKALLIDYPNQTDKKRFDKLVRSGEISKKADIGGLIEIHGDGGKGAHWTDGCIALENKEMDTVFSLCSNNTPVIIVGSKLSMEEYLN